MNESTDSNKARGWRPSLVFQAAMLGFFAAMFATVLVAWLGSRALIQAHLRGIDAKLMAVAAAMPEMLPAGYEARAAGGKVGGEEYEGLVKRLSEYADAAEIYYLYTYIEREGALLSTATSATGAERVDGSWTPLLQAYKQPPEAIREALREGKAKYAAYTDEFGSFRSVFLPRKDGETAYVIGADVRLDEIEADARQTFRTTMLTGIGIGVVVGMAGAWVGRRIAQPIADLEKHVRTFADDDFSNDEEAERRVGVLMQTAGPEVSRLAGTLLAMQRNLHEYLGRFEKLTQEKQHMLSQLQIARDIQRGLLPQHPPVVEGFEIAGWSEPAEHAGGDFYDWVVTPQGSVILTIADVTGHGIGPAIMAAVCRAYARATLDATSSLRSLIGRMNSLMSADLSDSRFVTYFVGLLDPAQRTLTSLSAGHGPVMVYRAATGAIEEAQVQGVPLGIVADFDFEPGTTIPLHPGDVLLMASDGFWEYLNAANEQFGIERLKTSLAKAAGLSAAEVIRSIRDDVAAFTAGMPQPDDMTAVVVKSVASHAG